MFTKFKILVGLVAVTLVSAVTIGLSTFYFGNAAKDERDIHNTVGETGGEEEIKADNILENYDFGQEDLNENYTYIFFPSTLYNEFSADGIDNPENTFGYNEVILDDFGDPVTKDGEVQYDVVVPQNSGVNFDGETFSIGTDYSNYYDLLKDSLNDNSKYYLYDLSSGDYPSDFKDKYFDSRYHLSYVSTHDVDRFYGIKINDPYSLNNYETYKYLTGLSAFTYNEDDYWPGNDFWVYDPDSSRNDTYKGPLGINEYKIKAKFYRPNVTHFSKSEEILTPIFDNPATGDVNESVYRSYSLTDSNSYVDYDFSIDLTADYNIDLTDDYNSRREKNEIQMYIDGMVSGEGLSSVPNENPDWKDKKNYDEQLQERRQYRNDRFGFWTEFYDWSTSSVNPNNGLYKEGTGSRYLPIKITTNGNLTPDTLAEILPDLSASMYSKDVYSDYTANVWTYNIGNSRDYSTATGGFTSKDITNIFDIMQNPSNYAENNVIRLYPVYSNGKVPISDTTPTRETGGRDALKAKFTYADSTDSSSNADSTDSSSNADSTDSSSNADSTDLSSKLITNKKLVYSSEEGKTDGGMTINYAILKNIYLEPYLYTGLSFDGDYSLGDDPRWSGKWHSMYRVSGDDLNEFLKTYGEGLYTFYLVVGNSARTDQASDDLINVEKILTESGSFPSLYQKSLIPWKFDTYYNDEFYGKGAYSCIQNGHNDWVDDNKEEHAEDISYNNRPVALFIEKVTNLRLVTDIPIKENEDGKPSEDQDWKGIDSSVQAGLLSAKNFLLADGVKTYNKDENGEPIDGQDVTSPYVYFIQNADFRYVNNLYFQIRFSNQYIPNALRIVTDFNEYQTDTRLQGTGITNKNPNQYVSYKIGNTTFELASQRALGDLYIQNASASSSDGTTREGFKLKDYYARGVYDIMLVANGNYTPNAGADEDVGADEAAGAIRVYNMYISRHTNSFIKVFDKNPGTFTYSSGGITGQFVSHKIQGENLTDGETAESYTTANKIWEGRGYLGEMFTSSSEFEDTSESLIESLQNHFKDYSGSSTLYKLVDAVTNRAVAYYDTTDGGVLFNSQGSTKNNNSIDLFMILKNYVLYLEPVTTNTNS